ncbi:MBL fold metallo-hydrolase [Paenibacillus sp. IB182363]|uniref:MBL fold metallo-hydrolase n=1 Tax=Paenibacillus oceani TaxID=2772510 RepID=A0A927C5L8_9BACL|nr:MBL fold metallo-hydrolase [Paenibacillus oceani]
MFLLCLIKNTAEAQAQLDQLPEPWRSALKRVLDHPPAAPVDRTITHGERLPIAGGLVVIGTPGHTPGHISLYHQPSRTLIAADALTVEDGRLLGPSAGQTHDMPLALRSLLALSEYDIDSVVCYHGGLYRDTNSRIRERIAEIARGG